MILFAVLLLLQFPAPWLEPAFHALWLPCRTDVPALQYEPVVSRGSFVLRDISLEFLAYGLRGLAVGKPKTCVSTAITGLS